MSNRLNIGILSTALIGQRSVIPAFNSLDNKFKLYAIASRKLEKAQNVATEYDMKAYGSYETLLEDPDLDAVYIPLPNSLHFEWVGKALDRGLHVLVEKSLACSFHEVELLTQKAQASNLILMEHFQFRFHRQINVILDLINSGKLGELRSVRASFGFPPFPEFDNIRYSSQLGGGALLDAAAYMMKITTILMGNDVEVKAASMSFDSDKGVDIWGTGLLQKKDSPLTAHIAYGFDHYYQCGIELWGSKGKLSTNRLFTARPGYEPQVELETADGKQTLVVPSDDHFQNILLFFHKLIIEKPSDLIVEEHQQNLIQAKLLQNFKSMATSA
jgi:dTDP-3,4-didehydro-2,6-dideoxy-alpha-D-glucose 3-reductase